MQYLWGGRKLFFFPATVRREAWIECPPNIAVTTALDAGLCSRRVMELLTQDWSLSSKLRLPAISRLQKVHNVDVALQVLRSKGVDLRDERGNYE